MPVAHSFSPASAFVHGSHQLLVLTDGAGMAEIERALLPLPLGRSSHARHRTDVRDPFSDPDRPLRLTVASDVATSPVRERRRLFALSHLPHVVLDILPEVDLSTSERVGRVSLSRAGDGVRVVTTRDPDKMSFDWYHEGAAAALAQEFDLDAGAAEGLAESITAHEALGNDYLVSPTLACRRDTHAFWGQAGACTFDEALFLAGLKERLYRMATISEVVRINTGWLYDAAATRLSAGLRRALVGALDPAANALQSRCTPHLLTIRSRLSDMLVCRDEIARLERREALGKDWPVQAERTRAVVGGSGNDLAVRVAYHVTAGLNAMTTILDNLAWVVAVREQIGAKPRRIGFDRLVAPTNDFPRTRASDKVAEDADHVHPVRRALALRAIRNETDHGTGLIQGWAMSVRGEARWGPEMLAIWVPRRGLLYRLPEGEAEAANELLDVATFAIDDLLLLRPRVLIEAALVCATELTSRLLGLYEWNSGSWLHQEATSRLDLQVLRLGRGRWHRGLWGWDLLPDALRGRDRDDDSELNRLVD